MSKIKQKTKKVLKNIKNPWREGLTVDRWSYVHFLTGILSGFAPLFFGWDIFLTFAIFFILTVIYEFVELILNIKEYKVNRVSDVILASLGFVTSYLVLFYLGIGRQFALAIFTGGLVLTVSMSVEGWRAYKKYGDSIK